MADNKVSNLTSMFEKKKVDPPPLVKRDSNNNVGKINVPSVFGGGGGNKAPNSARIFNKRPSAIINTPEPTKSIAERAAMFGKKPANKLDQNKSKFLTTNFQRQQTQANPYRRDTMKQDGDVIEKIAIIQKEHAESKKEEEKKGQDKKEEEKKEVKKDELKIFPSQQTKPNPFLQKRVSNSNQQLNIPSQTNKIQMPRPTSANRGLPGIPKRGNSSNPADKKPNPFEQKMLDKKKNDEEKRKSGSGMIDKRPTSQNKSSQEPIKKLNPFEQKMLDKKKADAEKMQIKPKIVLGKIQTMPQPDLRSQNKSGATSARAPIQEKNNSSDFKNQLEAMLFRPRPAPVKKPIVKVSNTDDQIQSAVHKRGQQGLLDPTEFAMSKPVFKHKRSVRGRGATNRGKINKLLDSDSDKVEEKKKEEDDDEQMIGISKKFAQSEVVI